MFKAFFSESNSDFWKSLKTDILSKKFGHLKVSLIDIWVNILSFWTYSNPLLCNFFKICIQPPFFHTWGKRNSLWLPTLLNNSTSLSYISWWSSPTPRWADRESFFYPFYYETHFIYTLVTLKTFANLVGFPLHEAVSLQSVFELRSSVFRQPTRHQQIL